jgi:hypothetical protein
MKELTKHLAPVNKKLEKRQWDMLMRERNKRRKPNKEDEKRD